jgi:regulator of sirC expression with transglutaminase-like and TPR domain
MMARERNPVGRGRTRQHRTEPCRSDTINTVMSSDTLARAHLTRLLELPDGQIPVAEAALRIAQEEYPEIDVDGYLERLSTLGRQLSESVTAYSGGLSPQEDGSLSRGARLRALKNFLIGEHGFRGPSERENYYDPRHSYLNEVLDRRVGIPITLSLVYLEVGRAIGLGLAGVGFPGHFLVKTVDEGPELLLDPFHQGREVSIIEAMGWLENMSGGRKLPPERFLNPITERQFLQRLLYNLKAIYVREEQHQRAVGVIDRLILIDPGVDMEHRDRGLLYLQMGHYNLARADLESYLRLAPQAKDRVAVERRIDQARQLAERMN